MASSTTPRERRRFTAAFTRDAVRRLTERRSEGGTLAEVSRELDLA